VSRWSRHSVLKSRFPALRSLGQCLRSRRDQARAHAFIVAAVVLHNLFLYIISFSTTPSEWTLSSADRSPRSGGGGGEGAGAEASATDVQPRREALINQMLELEDNEDLDNLEL